MPDYFWLREPSSNAATLFPAVVWRAVLTIGALSAELST